MRDAMTFVFSGATSIKNFVRGLFSRNKTMPCLDFAPTHDSSNSRCILNTEEAQKFLIEAKERNHPCYPVWATALLTGMRNSEMLALRWGDVNMFTKVITISRYMSMDEERHASGTREIPISPELAKILNSLKQTSTSDFVFPRIKQWVSKHYPKMFQLFLKEIGIKRVSLNTLRQTWATMELKKGTSIPSIMKNLGWHHKDITNPYNKNPR